MATAELKTANMPKYKITGLYAGKQKKLDIGKALKLRIENKLSYDEIALRMNCSKAHVHQSLQRFMGILKEPEEIEAYNNHRTALLASAEMAILEKITDPDTVQKASLNNAAYTFTALHNAGRLERGQSTNNVDIRQLSMSLSDLQAEQKRLEKELNIQDIVQTNADKA